MFKDVHFYTRKENDYEYHIADAIYSHNNEIYFVLP